MRCACERCASSQAAEEPRLTLRIPNQDPMTLMIALPFRLLIAVLFVVAAFTLALNLAVSAPRHDAQCGAEHGEHRRSGMTVDEKLSQEKAGHPAPDIEAGCCGLGCNLVMPFLASDAGFPDLPRHRAEGLAVLPLAGVEPAGVRRPPKRSA